jgi:hypothetical protein
LRIPSISAGDADLKSALRRRGGEHIVGTCGGKVALEPTSSMPGARLLRAPVGVLGQGFIHIMRRTTAAAVTEA